MVKRSGIIASTTLALIAALTPSTADYMRHRYDGVQVSITQPSTNSVSFNQEVGRGSKELQVKQGEPFSLFSAVSDYDRIRETRLYVNGTLQETDNKDYYFDHYGYYPGSMIGSRNFFGASLENYFHEGSNTIVYEMIDTQGNSYSDFVEVVISD